MQSEGAKAVTGLTPFAPGFRDDPYPFYRRLREQQPVAWSPLGVPGFWGFWFLSRYADVVAVLKDPRFGRELQRVLPPQAFPPLPPDQQPLVELTNQWLVMRDPPDHTRLRGLVNRAFTRSVVELLVPRIQQIADQLLDAACDAGPPLNLMTAFASPLPILSIAELLGLPAEDRGLFKEWSIAVMRAVDAKRTAQDIVRGSQAARSQTEYFRALIAERRRRPRPDLIGELIAAEEQGDRLNEEELFATAAFLLLAGHETTTNLIGNGTLALLRHPDQAALLRSEPALIGSAVEECLRYDSPQQIVYRFALETATVNGQVIRKGQMVACGLGAANRDPEAFTDPERFDVRRSDNRHLAFGQGIHYCSGVALARVEGQIAFCSLLERFPHLGLSQTVLEWEDKLMLRGLRTLEVVW